jgi:UDP-3-O-[3-hydroxymyristoyl] glucosamine N-acyltransferase
MKFEHPVILSDLVGYSYNVEGKNDVLIHGLGVVYSLSKGDICFAENEKILNKLICSECNAIITTKTLYLRAKNKKNKTFVITDNPSKLFSKILNELEKELPNFIFNATTYNTNGSKVSTDAYIDDDVKFGNNCIVYPQVYIDRNVTLGNFVAIYPGVKIFSKTTIGNGVIIKSNAIIGNNPNWLYKDNDLYYDFIGKGGVIINDNVSIGSNTVIDRGLVENTIIESNSKIGNNVEIGHGAHIERNVLIISQSGVAGGAHIGKNTKIQGQCGIDSNIFIAANTTINVKTIITKDIKEENKSYFGIPGEEKKFYSKKRSAINKLPRLLLSNESFKIHGNLPSTIATIISEQLDVDVDKIDMKFNFINDGGADSLDLVELILAIEEQFDINILDDEETKIKTVTDLYKLLRRKGITKDYLITSQSRRREGAAVR